MCGVEFAAGENEKNVNQLKGTALGITIKGLELTGTMAACLLAKWRPNFWQWTWVKGNVVKQKSSNTFLWQKSPVPWFTEESNSVHVHMDSTSSVE